jgi:hypothetical protein
MKRMVQTAESITRAREAGGEGGES